MSKNILKALFFLSIVSMVFVGGDVLAATCGSAIEQGWPTAPATNLCSDGTLSGSVYLDQQQGNWSWACSGGADPAFVFCSAPLVSDNGWMLKASWAYPRTTSTVASTGSKIYAVGGYRYPLESPYNSIEEYNPWTNNWTAKDDTYSYKSGMAAYVSGYVYFIGGQSSVLTGSNKRYSPSSDSWTDRAAMPTPRRSAAAAVANGKIYIFGGYVSAGAGWTNINEEYNPGTNNWTTKAPMPSSRMAMGAATVNNKIYVIGGILSTTGSATNRNEEYDPATNTWTTKAPMPTARYHTYPVVYDNKIYVIGGYGSSWLTVNEVYDPATNTWATANSMPQAVSDAVVAMANNKIYVMGGYDGRITLEYDPAFANGSCGTADGHGYYSTSEIDTVSERCATGTFTSFTDNGSYWSWTCSGSGGGSDASCSADKVAAGTDNEKTLKDQPSTNLCAYGTATTPTLSNDIIWYWTCTNNPGVDAAGFAYKTTCGSSNGGSFSSPPETDLCTTHGGVESNVTTGETTYTWTCTGDDSLPVNCSATRVECGTANGHGYQSTSYIDTAAERCAAGTFTSFTDNGSSWGWGCNNGSPWTTKAPMPTPRGSLTAASINNKIYAIGGDASGIPYMNNNEEYDPATNTWTTKTPMSVSRIYFGAAVVNNKIYAIGGYNIYDYYPDTYLNFNEEYDPATNIWTTKAPMPTPRNTSAVVAVNNKIYAIGGGETTNINEEYDPATNTWTTKAPMPTPRHGLAAAVVNNKIYVMGGWSGGTGTTNINEEYDPATNTWTTKAPMPGKDQYFRMAVVNNKIYVMGGVYYSNANREYDPATNTWTTRTNMPVGGADFGIVAVNNKIYTMWGSNNYEYDPANDTVATCSADKVAAGTDNEKTLKDQPSTNLCAYGTATTPTLSNDIIWYWTCTNNPGVDAAGFAYKTTCGSSNGGSFSSPPETDLCTTHGGVESNVTTGETTYTWTCTGDDSLPVNCSATRITSVDGSCGAAQGQLSSAPPSNLCSAGTEDSFTTNATTYTWTCNGSEGGSDANCSSNRISFKNPYDINNDESCWFCEHYYDVGGILRDGELSSGMANLQFKFTTNASDYNSYKLAIGTINDVSQAMQTDEWLSVSSSETTFSGAKVRKSGTDQKNGSNGFYLTYGNGTSGKTYYWWVKLRKPDLTESEWMYGGTIATPEKAFPVVRVAADKATVTVGTNIQYCTTLIDLQDTNDSCYPVCWTGTGDPVVDPDNANWKCSVCYNSSNQPVPCTTANGNAFSWVLPEQSGSYMETTNALSANPIFRFSTTVQNAKPGLAVSGSECAGEGETGTKAPLPQWREVAP